MEESIPVSTITRWIASVRTFRSCHATYEGKEGLRRRNRQFTESWEDLTFQPLEFIDAGDEVLAVVAMRGHGKGSDTPMEAVIAFVYQVRDGRIFRDRAFTSKSQALEAAGLRE
jgi:ketosteroid isomerase-like protein